jgi:hypothetical protein
MLNLKNKLKFNMIRKTIADENGNITIKSDRYFKTLMFTYLQAKNELIFRSTGIHLINVDDMEEVFSWSEGFCEHFFKCMGSDISPNDKMLCPWCVMHLDVGFRHIYAKPNDVCMYGKRHGFCSQQCGNSSNSTYGRIQDEAGSIRDIDGMRELYYYYVVLADLKK